MAQFDCADDADNELNNSDFYDDGGDDFTDENIDYQQQADNADVATISPSFCYSSSSLLSSSALPDVAIIKATQHQAHLDAGAADGTTLVLTTSAAAAASSAPFSSISPNTNFRLCSVVTMPNTVDTTNYTTGPPVSANDNDPAMIINVATFHRRNYKKQKKPARPPSFGAIRRFDQVPPPPLTALYTSLTDLLSPRPLTAESLNGRQLSTRQHSPENAHRNVVVTDNRYRMALSRSAAPTLATPVASFVDLQKPRIVVRAHIRRRKTAESLVSSSMSDCLGSDDSSTSSSSDDDAVTTTVATTTATAARSAVEEDRSVSSAALPLFRNREGLHSALRRSLEVVPSPDSAIRTGVSTESLTSLLRVRQLSSAVGPNPATAGASSSSVSRCQTPSTPLPPPPMSNTALAFSIRDMFLKHFGAPPVTAITTASPKVRESIIPMELTAQPAPQHRRQPTPVQKRMRSAVVTTSATPVTSSGGQMRQFGNNKDDSPYNNHRYEASSAAPTTAPGRSRVVRNGEQGGDEMGDAPDPPDGRRPAATRAPRVSLVGNQQPTYYIGGHNGSALVEAPLAALGWKRITDKACDTFRLKWCDIKGSINYSAFREGEQMVNHIPNSQLLTNKLGLLNSLQDYDRQLVQSKRRGYLRLNQFYPETYRLDDRADREAFMQAYKDGEIWICKPTGLNQGIGIHLVRTLEEARALADDRENRMAQARGQVRQPMTRIVQRYILRPLLLEGRKFDIRCYMLIGSTSPWLVLYHKGYIRLSIHTYHPDSPNLTVHLTNQYIQKKDSAYKDVKESTAWSMDQFNTYVNDHLVAAKGIERDWVYNTMTRQIQKIIVHIFSAVRNKLSSKVGYFELYGLDFMIDDNMKVYLIEVNTNPSLSTNCTALADIIPSVVSESVGVVIESFEKARKGQPLLPLKSLNGFTVLFHGQRRTIDMGPGDQGPTDAEEDEKDVVTWPKLLMPTGGSFDTTLRRALSIVELSKSAGEPGRTFDSNQSLQRFQQKIVARGPSYNNGKLNSLPDKQAQQQQQQQRRAATKSYNSTGLRDSSSDDEGRSSKLPPGQKSARSISNWPQREPASQLMKKKQEVQQRPLQSSLSVGVPLGSDPNGDEKFGPRKSVLIKDPLFKPFRIVIVEDSNSPPPDRATNSSTRRSRSLSPVKVNQGANNSTSTTATTANRNPPSPKMSPGPPTITPRPRTVRQTLSTSVATVRVSNTNNTSAPLDGSDDLTPVTSLTPTMPSDGSTTQTRYSFNNGQPAVATPSMGQRQVSFAPMALPTVRLQLTQVQFPYPVIAGQTIASVPASALGSNGPVVSSNGSGIPIISPYQSRVKIKERKDRGN